MTAKPQPAREIEGKLTNGHVEFRYKSTFKRLARDLTIVLSSITGAYLTAQKVIAAHDAQFEAQIVACVKDRSDDRSTIQDQGRRIRELEELLSRHIPIFQRDNHGTPTTTPGLTRSTPAAGLQRPVADTYARP